MYPKILAMGLMVAGVTAFGADLIPVEDFARPAKFREIELSPDGEYIGFIREHDGVDRMCFADVATMKMGAVDLGRGKHLPVERGVSSFDWIGPKRLILRTSMGFYAGGWVALDRDRKNVTPLSGDIAEGRGIRLEASGFYPRRILFEFPDSRNVLVENPRYDYGLDDSQFPEVVKLDTRSGSGVIVVKNPGTVVRWAADLKGDVRLGVSIGKGVETILYRDTVKSDWRKLVEFPGAPGIIPYRFAPDNKRVYIETRPRKGLGQIHLFDPEKQELGEVVWSDPVYEPDGLSREPVTGKVIGVRYTAEARKIKWLDAKYQALQEAVDATLPDRDNLLVNFTDDLQRMLVVSYSDRAPDVAYLYDIAKGELRELGKSRGWIKPEQMARTHPITYKARDGLEIHAYLTVPNGAKPKNLPFVVMPHGGPSARDEWRFDPLVQMLANRGYAVLQMNYRGSDGYGREFSHMSRGEVGGKVQDDIEDATKWAISRKLADPRRIAIVGGSYGGYSALFGLAKSPGMYCCGISIAGVTDWPGIYDNIDPELSLARDHWRRLFGDPKNEIERLKAISPVNFADEIKVPVLIIQGEDDWIVPPKQAKKMIAAMEACGRKPESLFIEGEAHGFRREAGRLAEFKAIEAFLAKHLGAGETAAAAAGVAKN